MEKENYKENIKKIVQEDINGIVSNENGNVIISTQEEKKNKIKKSK